MTKITVEIIIEIRSCLSSYDLVYGDYLVIITSGYDEAIHNVVALNMYFNQLHYQLNTSQFIHALLTTHVILRSIFIRKSPLRNGSYYSIEYN